MDVRDDNDCWTMLNDGKRDYQTGLETVKTSTMEIHKIQSRSAHNHERESNADLGTKKN